MDKPGDAQLAALSRREARTLIVALRSPHRSNTRLAEVLGVTPGTIQAQLTSIRKKFGWPAGKTRIRLLMSGVTEQDVLRAYCLPAAHAHEDAYDYIMRVRG